MHRNKQKEGISTIIAAIFVVAIMVVGLNVMTYVSNLQNNFAQVEAQKNQKATERVSEQLQLTGVTIKNNQFNITLYNTGSLPVHLVRMWVTNNTATNWHQSWDLTSNNYYINPRNTTRNIGQSLTPTLSYCVSCGTKPTYTFGVVTERGTMATYKLAGGSDAQLYVRLIAPSTVISGQNVTITMLVEHNNTLADAVLNIAPNSLTITTPSGGSYFYKSGPDPVSDPSIMRGSSRSYTWIYQLYGNNATSFTITGSLQNSQSNVSPPITVTVGTVKVTSTDLSKTSGILTITYGSFRQTTGTAWSSGMAVTAGANTAFKMDITNNNSTGGCNGGNPNCTYWLSKSTSFNLLQLSGGTNPTPFYIVNGVTLSPLSLTAYSCSGQNDFCLSIPPGQTVTIYFGAANPSTINLQKVPINVNIYTGNIALFGKFASNGGAQGPTIFGQNISVISLSAT